MKHIFLLTIILPNLMHCQRNTIGDVGDFTQLLLPITAGATTILLKDKEGTWQFVKSFVTTAVITFTLKHTIKKERPAGGMQSFPSGHTSAAFSGASFIQLRYGWKYGIPAYALAVYTGFSRVYAKRHYTIDVLAGALIGIGSTYVFTTPYQKEHFEFVFSSTPEHAYLIGLKYKF